jgi:hypothetical protein
VWVGGCGKTKGSEETTTQIKKGRKATKEKINIEARGEGCNDSVEGSCACACELGGRRERKRER